MALSKFGFSLSFLLEGRIEFFEDIYWHRRVITILSIASK